MSKKSFSKLITPLLKTVAGEEINSSLTLKLDKIFPSDGVFFTSIKKTCLEGIEEGWMCAQGGPGRRFGRVLEASAENENLSVDVVDLQDIKGPHHSHPLGEICMIMPITDTAKFDNKGAGWCVYKAGSAHHPTVSEGRALVLYLLPNGQITFT